VVVLGGREDVALRGDPKPAAARHLHLRTLVVRQELKNEHVLTASLVATILLNMDNS
jgi:hypothetical protein